MCTCVRRGERENDNVTGERGIGEKKYKERKKEKGGKKRKKKKETRSHVLVLRTKRRSVWEG